MATGINKALEHAIKSVSGAAVLKIVHFTSVHPRYDVRIFWKQCRTLAEAGFDITLVVADGKGDETKDGVKIVDAGRRQGGRVSRMVLAARKVVSVALALDADVYHFHDPELLPHSAKLIRAGKKVIFDSHEDFVADIQSKSYINKHLRSLVSVLYSAYERIAVKRINHVVAATPAIRMKFERMGIRCIDINNYPLKEEIDGAFTWDESRSSVCYIGAITSIRGVECLIDAMPHVNRNVCLDLVGPYTEPGLHGACQNRTGWKRVNDHGVVDRASVREVMKESLAGIVTFLPAPNHVDAQPNKMFEYMSAGIPVICSDFPLWKEIVQGHSCGLCVNPEDPSAIAAAINQLYADQEYAKSMGRNGWSAVLNKYNWTAEAPKLLALYKSVLGG